MSPRPAPPADDTPLPEVLVLVTMLAAAAWAQDPIRSGPVGPLIQVSEGFTSLFLLDLGDGTWAAFDAGVTPLSLRRALSAVGATPADLSHVFLTHSHSDHVGAIGSVPRAARIHAGAAEAPLLAASGIAATDLHSDGDLISAGVWTVEAFSLPGHTPGSVAWLVGGVLLMGDTLIVDQGRLAPLDPAFHDDPAQNRVSLADLRAEVQSRPPGTVSIVAPSHSDWLTLP